MSAVATLPPLPFTPIAAPSMCTDGPRPMKWTREQYYKLSELGYFEGKRVQLIFGEIIEMGNQNRPHALAIGLVLDVLQVVFAGVGFLEVQTPQPTDDSDSEPDVRVVAGKRRDYPDDHPRSALLVVEVADTSLFYDTTTKAELYATAGIADYWVLDVENRQLHIFRDPVALPVGLGATAYGTHITLDATFTVSPLAAPSAIIAVADLLP